MGGRSPSSAMMSVVDDGVLDFMGLLADAADTLTSAAWLNDELAVTTKADGSPVTATDFAVEATLRDLVHQRFPADGFLGEEVGPTAGISGRAWIVDGIDGTAAFVRGRREWSTLIAFADNDRIVAGLASSPALGRRWSGMIGDGAEVVSSGGEPGHLGVSDREVLNDARISSWPPPSSVADPFRLPAERLSDLTPPPTQRPSWDAEVPNGAMLVAEDVSTHSSCLAVKPGTMLPARPS